MSMNDEQESFKITDRRNQEKETVKQFSKPVEQPTQTQEEPISFSGFVLSLCSSAMIQMGYIPDPETNKKSKNMNLAKQQIDLIELLRAKSKGNTTKEENELFEQALYELKMRYVEALKLVG